MWTEKRLREQAEDERAAATVTLTYQAVSAAMNGKKAFKQFETAVKGLSHER